MKTLFSLVMFFCTALVASAATTADIAGSYRCYSANAGNVASNCRLFTPILLQADGTYSVSSEKGTYRVKGDTITLSASKLRGVGKMVDGTKLRFEYDYKGLHQVVTYLRDNVPEKKIPKKGSTKVEHAVEVELAIVFPEGYGVDYFNVVELVPPADSKLPTYQSITYASDKRTLKVYYSPTKGVTSGYLYTVYASTGNDRVKVGTLDLRAVTKNSYTAKINFSSL